MTTPDPLTRLWAVLDAATEGRLYFQREEIKLFDPRPDTTFEVYRNEGLYAHPATCEKEPDARAIVTLLNLRRELKGLVEEAHEVVEDYTRRCKCGNDGGSDCEACEYINPLRDALAALREAAGKEE